MNYQEYEVWHDEYRGDDAIDEYWHGVLFVPVNKRNEIIKILKKIKTEYKIPLEDNAKFAGSLKTNIKSKYICNVLSLFQHILIIREDKANTNFFNRTRKNVYEKEFQSFMSINGLFGCKFALLKIPDNHKSLNDFDEYAKKVETTFRFVFKNGCHTFFKNNPALIRGIFFDGYEHHKRHIDGSRIIPCNLREYINVTDSLFIDDRGIKERNDDTKIMINFMDNIIGGIVAKIKMIEDKYNALYSISEIYERLQNGTIFKNLNSRWYMSILASEFKIRNGMPDFPDIFRNTNQPSLFNEN